MDYSARWQAIKTAFSKQIPEGEFVRQAGWERASGEFGKEGSRNIRSATTRITAPILIIFISIR